MYHYILSTIISLKTYPQTLELKFICKSYTHKLPLNIILTTFINISLKYYPYFLVSTINYNR